VGLINQVPTQDELSPRKEYFLSFPLSWAYKSNAKNINAVGLINQAPAQDNPDPCAR
jgi:hypothetical protein